MDALKKMIVAAAVAVAGFAAVAAEASSSETYSFTYQACLRDEHGEPIKKDGVVQRNQKVTIRLWGDATSAKNPLWARKYAVYTDETGLFNLEVSDSTSDDQGLQDGYGDPRYSSLAEALTSRPAGQIYIGLFVEGSAGEIVPRQRLFAVPYAAVANDVRAITKDIAVGGNIQFGTQSDGLVLSKDGIKQSGSASSSTFSKVQADVVQANTISSGGQTVTVDKGLDIKGSATASKGLTVSSGGLTVSSGDLTVSSGDLTVSGKLTASSFNIVPKGVIVMWSGSASAIPDGWALCNGENETPDLRDRFIVGAGNKYSVGAKGGSDSVTLTTNQMPKHDHDFQAIFHIFETQANSMTADYNDQGYGVRWVGTRDKDYNAWYGGGNFYMPSVGSYYASERDTDVKVSEAGGNGSHENRPPYYALCFIMKK